MCFLGSVWDGVGNGTLRSELFSFLKIMFLWVCLFFVLCVAASRDGGGSSKGRGLHSSDLV